MGPDDIVSLLSGAGTFETVQQAIEALKLNTNQFLTGVGYKISGGAGAAAAAAEVGIEGMLDFFSKQTLKATATEVKTAAVGLAKKGAESVGTLLLGVDLGVVGAAVAPFGGVALGAGLYKSNPELWTKISQTLIPWGWKDTVKMPVWAQYVEDTGKWVCSIPKKLVDSILSLFNEEGIGQPVDYEEVPTDSNIYPLVSPVFVNTGVGIDRKNTNLGRNAREIYYYTVVRGTGGAIGSEGQFSGSYTGPSLLRFLLFSTEANGMIVRNTVYNSSNDKTVDTTYSSPSSIIVGDTRVYYVYGISGVDFQAASDTRWYGGKQTATSTESGFTDSQAENIVRAIFPLLSEGGRQYYPAGTTAYSGTKPELTLGHDVYFGPDTLEPTYDINLPGLDALNDYMTAPWTQYKEGSIDAVDIPNAPTGVLDIPDFNVPWENVKPWVIPSDIPGEYVGTDAFIQEAVKDGEWADFAEPEPPTLIPALPPAIPFGQVDVPNVPSTPLPFSSTAGFVTVYHPTTQQLYDFQSWLWVKYAEVDTNKIWNNPFDGVVSLFELYCTPTDTGSRNIHSGFLDSGINSAVISRYTEINCGTLAIPEYWGNYLDYSPYTRAYIYLPFIGIQELHSDDIIGAVVNVTYRIDEYNGSCIALITVAKSIEVDGEQKSYQNVMYQFTGNCSVELPFSGGSQAQIKAGFMIADAYQSAANVSALGQALGGLASILSTNPLGGVIGGVGGAMATAAYGQAQATANMLSGKSVVAHSGQFGSSHGPLGVKKPFITVVRPKQIQVEGYNKLYGYPAHKQVIVGNCTGFLRCLEVHVISSTATDEEKSIIESMMKSGVYVTE